MKKSERLNQELIFLQDKRQFNIKDLTEEFHISKCTAIRDIGELENMGLSLYTDLGRSGKYHILSQNLLTPVYFNEDEIASILFAMQAMEKITFTPFEKSWPQVYQKLMATLPKEKGNAIKDLLSNVSYSSIPSVAKTNFLRDIMLAAKDETVLDIQYQQHDFLETSVYVLNLFFQDGTWYFNGYDLNTNKWEIYRCDCILKCKKKHFPAESVFSNKSTAMQNLKNFIAKNSIFSFACRLTIPGKEHFLKTNYYGMALQEDTKGIIMSGKIETKDMKYLVQYLISFGKELEVLSPE